MRPGLSESSSNTSTLARVRYASRLAEAKAVIRRATLTATEAQIAEQAVPRATSLGIRATYFLPTARQPHVLGRPQAALDSARVNGERASAAEARADTAERACGSLRLVVDSLQRTRVGTQSDTPAWAALQHSSTLPSSTVQTCLHAHPTRKGWTRNWRP